jgi:CRISPR-associated protein Csb2
MFGLGIRYLMGWAMAAADGAKKEKAEWPPHPDRIYMALASAWFETGQDSREGNALNWLETIDPPGICASEKKERTIVTSYVPVNDICVMKKKTVETICADSSAAIAKYKEAGLSLLPEFRSRQPRSFPVAIPDNPFVHLVWNIVIPDAHIEPLSSLCRKVMSIGHSASLVQMWLTFDPPNPNLIPIFGFARHRLRIFGPGRLQYLNDRYNHKDIIEFLDREKKIEDSKGKEKSLLKNQQKTRFPVGRPVSLRPEPGLWCGYDKPEMIDNKPSSSSLFDPRLVIFSLTGKRLSLPATLKLTETFRGAIFSMCQEPIPEWLTGHTAQGEPSAKPHIALLPLPFAGSEHAEGRLMGIAIALPRGLDAAEMDRILFSQFWNEHGEERKIKLFNGQWLECEAELETRESPPVNLRSETWTDSSRCWATVTPLVLDRHFDGKDKWSRAAESVKDSCERVGLPRPIDVLLQPVSMFEGVPRSSDFPWISRKNDGGRMYHVHAVIIFNVKVWGPVIIGAGRFRGYGFCRPVKSGG